MVGIYDLQQFTVTQYALIAKTADNTPAAAKELHSRVHDNEIFTDEAPKPKKWSTAQLKALNRLLRSLLNAAVSWETFEYIVLGLGVMGTIETTQGALAPCKP